MSLIYLPAEDSYLISKVLENEIPRLLKKNKDLKFLEVGSGSGILLKTAEKIGIKKQNIFALDINQKAVKHCRKLGFNCIYSNLFENVNGKFSIVVFNPPYLPQDKYDKEKDTTGGKKGSETINKFLKQAKKHLEKNGRIFLLTSSLTKGINWLNYHRKILGNERLFMEKLSVWELKIKSPLFILYS